MTRPWTIATVRHGETDYNKESRYAGSIDVSLNEAGRKDAALAAERVRAKGFEVTVSSPLRRALETARLLTEGRTEIVTSSHARERDYGILQGLTGADVEQVRPPVQFIKVGGDYHSVVIPGAETLPELRARAEAFHRYLLDNHLGKRVLVVSHGVFLQQFHGLLRGQDWIDALGRHVGNLELTIFGFEDERLSSEGREQLVERSQSGF